MRLRFDATVTASGAILAAASSAWGDTESRGGNPAITRRTITRVDSTWPDWAGRSVATRRVSVWAARLPVLSEAKGQDGPTAIRTIASNTGRPAVRPSDCLTQPPD